MRSRKSRVLLSLALLTVSIGFFAVAGSVASQRGGNGAGPGNGAGGALVPLNDAEKATLVFMREEEKLARDVYITMFEKWDDKIFSNISAAEQRHMDAILVQLVKYGVPDPAAGLEIGSFKNADLQKAFDELVAQGEMSLADALRVGRLIEEMDIEDLLAAIDETSKTDLDRVYGNLLKASYAHLKAFTVHPACSIKQ